MKTCFPARKANGEDYASLNEVMDRIGREAHGSWLAGTNRMWHGGIHLTEVTAPGALLSESGADKAVPLQCMADGEIVAWRVNHDYLTGDYCGKRAQYSSTFLLVKSVCKPDPDNAKSWLEFYALYMGLAPLSAFPKHSRYRVTAQGDGVRLRRHTGYETTGQPVPEPSGDTLGEGACVLILRRESFVLQGKAEPFGLAQPLKDGKPHGATCWVSLREGYLEDDGDAYGNLPDWMRQAVTQGTFDAVVNPSEPLRIAAGDAVGFLAEDIAPAGRCELAPSHFVHIEVLSVDPRMPYFLTNPGNVDAGTRYIRLGLHKPMYLRTGELFEAMNAITERDGGKLLERDKCHPVEYGGKTYYQIRPHTWMCGDDVDEVRQFDLAAREFSALTENTTSDMKNSLKAGWMRDALGWFAERMNPDKGMRQGTMSRYYKGMVDKLDTDHDGMLSARELFAAVHHPEMGIRRLASRLVVKHDSEWFGGSAHHKWTTFFQDYDVLRMDYAKKWLDDCEWMSQVPAFSSGGAVWHMHPVVFIDAIKGNEYDFSTKEGTIKAIIEESRKQGFSLNSQIAYILATVKRETGDTFQPVREGNWTGHTSTDEYRKKHYRYYPYYGRGYVQITWDYNYKAYSEKLGVDLVSDPDKALEPNNSLFILIDGFKNGVFTGKKLTDYVNESKVDFFHARRCINGLDHAEQIKGFAEDFLRKLDAGELN